jgi:hypothetical protein
MKICQYCNEKISWFGGVDHTKCNAVAETHKSNIHAYIKKSIIAGNFNIKNTPAAFKDAEQFLTASEVENAIAFGYDDAVRHIIDDALVDDKERKNWDAFRNNLEINLKQSFAEVSKWLNIYGTDKYLHMAMVLSAIKNGEKLVKINSPSQLMLTNDEVFIYSWENVSTHALNTKKKFSGHSTGGSYRLSKKITLRHTQHRGKPILYEEWDPIGIGEIAITNKHLYFLGYHDAKDVKERLSNITSLDPTDDCFIVNINLKSRPAYQFSFNSNTTAWLASNIILNAQRI